MRAPDVRPLICAAVCAALAAWTLPGAAQQYPVKPVRILTPYPAGSGVDFVARLIAPPLSQALGQPVVVDNRSGAGGTLGCEIAAKAPPDGYTLLLGNASVLVMAPGLYPRAAYDSVKSFAPITLIASSANVLVAHPSVPARSVKELLALAKAKPGALNYGTSGSGSSPHLSAELFKSMTGVKGFEVNVWQGMVAPAGTPPAILALLNRQIAAAVQLPETRERLASQGLDPTTTAPEEFGAIIVSELAKWSKLIKAAGITAD